MAAGQRIGADAATTCDGFVGASSLERMGVEESLTGLTRKFKSLTVPRR